MSTKRRRKKHRKRILSSGKCRKIRRLVQRIVLLAAVIVLTGVGIRFLVPYEDYPEPWRGILAGADAVFQFTGDKAQEALEASGRELETLLESAGLEVGRITGLWGRTGGGVADTGNVVESFALPEPGELVVDFLDVGQGDCTLIMLDGHALLFDCGPDDKGTYIQNYLEKQGITSLDYVIGSHPDEDHIGGMDVVLTKFDCETVMMPDVTRNTACYRNVETALTYRGYEAVHPLPGQVYGLGNASFTIVGPVYKYEASNNNSIAIRLEYGGDSFLFTGDAEEEEEADMLGNGAYLTSEVYQVGHHGSASSSSGDFLAAVSPEYAVISCGADNDYGHPHEQTLERLTSLGTKIFRTDTQGTIRASSYGDGLSWQQSKAS